MCELLGLSFAQPISADFSMREFELHDEENPDGWGLAWYPDQSLAIAKEPVEWGASTYSGFLESYHGLRSHIYIGHVRHRTRGGPPTHADTHPFGRELGGREYCFAHNGTLEWPEGKLTLGRYRPIGNTDSEHMFCHLLDDIAGRANQLTTPQSWAWLHEKLTDLNRWGRINCLLADGQRLFCYHDAAGWKGLTIREVYVQDCEKRFFADPQVQLDLKSPSVNHGYVVATRPLSPSGWHNFLPGELMVLENGVARFSSRSHQLAAPDSRASA
jgi:glutamine amidotransferase